MSNSRPSFLKTYFRLVSESIDSKPLRLLPFWLLAGLGIGCSVAWFVPAAFWNNANWGASVTVYAGVLAFDGLLLALGWGAFSKIFEILSSGDFAEFIRRNDLLEDHLFYVDFVHFTLMMSAFFAGLGLASVLLPLPLWLDRLILGVAVGVSLWASLKAGGAVKMMGALIWENAHYKPDDGPHNEGDQPEEVGQVTLLQRG